VNGSRKVSKGVLFLHSLSSAALYTDEYAGNEDRGRGVGQLNPRPNRSCYMNSELLVLLGKIQLGA
jgi:hypothetical protein